MESKAARGGESKPGEFLFWLQTKSELELKSNMQTDMYGFNVNQQLNMMAIAVAECAELEVSGSNSWGNSLNTHSGSLPLLGGGGEGTGHRILMFVFQLKMSCLPHFLHLLLLVPTLAMFPQAGERRTLMNVS